MGGLFSSQTKEVKQDKEKEKQKPIPQQQLPKQQQQQQKQQQHPLMSDSLNQQPQSKKPFNIQLSEDDKDTYNLNPGDEDEEEEEYEIDEQISTDIQSKNSTSNPTRIENVNNKQREADKVIDDTGPLSSSRSNSIPIYIEQKEETSSEKKLKGDPNAFCHRIRKKNTFFSLEEVQYYSIHKLKERESLLSSFGFVDSKVIKKEYIAFFEEGHIYFSKDIVIEKKPQAMRKIGNKYPLKDISNIFFEKESKFYMLIHFEFTNDSNNGFACIQKEFYLDISIVDKFISDLQQRLKLLGIECTSNDDEEHHQEEEETPSDSPKDQMPYEIQLMGE